RESTTSCPGRAKRDPGPRHPICGPGSPLSRGRTDGENPQAHQAYLHMSTRAFAGQWELALLQDAAPAGPRGGHFGRIAQLVEQLTLNQRVPGSSPGAPTNRFDHLSTGGTSSGQLAVTRLVAESSFAGSLRLTFSPGRKKRCRSLRCHRQTG